MAGLRPNTPPEDHCRREDPEAFWIGVPLRSTATPGVARLTVVRLWDRPASRAPPAPDEPEQLDLELQYVDTNEFLMAL
jgi:hypothetical protein